MVVAISSIKLKSIFHFFQLSHYALFTTLQLKKTNCIKFKKRGFWTTHYTITMWRNEEDMKSFSTSGAHLKAIKSSSKIAKEIRTTVIYSNEIPNWSEAKDLLKKGKKHNLN
ncbi:DUF3291 domain-containing protein [Psychroserpens sp. S379A]|uniref:DUF3291 domain-containing protein n=1 Tax=Psychroserpens sp. S379A TaxID=3415137 RepID=UPI003C7A3614